jgi:hypothetical protein
VTYHNDNARTGVNTTETLLTPANVNKNNFGLLFSQNLDGIVVGQPLYLSNVFIPGKDFHNVVYVGTQHDSVYAFDADNNTGSNASPLWQVSFIDPAAGVTTVPGAIQKGVGTTAYTELGIVSTPVIDANTGTLYVVAKTMENGVFVHRLHALDVATGQERFNGPAVMSGSFTTNTGSVVNFRDLYQMNRPALLLANGIVYAAFGSNCCNYNNMGWVLAFDATTLQQVGAFDTSPTSGLSSIWQCGVGPAADSEGNVYASTGEGAFNADVGGQDLGSSILKLTQGPGTLTLGDYFTPYNQAFLSQMDLDLSSSGVLLLPDQPGPHPHLALASGKQGTLYLLDRDNMGGYNPFDNSQIVQELVHGAGHGIFGSPVYWNNRVYTNGVGSTVKAFSLSGGLLSTSPVAQSVPAQGGHPPTISANGNTNGIVWFINGSPGQLWALDATTLATLYISNQAGTRDVLPVVAHFATQTVANGKVYIGTRKSLVVYGLFSALNLIAGNNQSALVNTTLPISLQVQAVEPYSGRFLSGVTVTFSDGGKGGVFSNLTAVTDSSGLATTTYTFSKVKRTVTITASSPGLAKALFTETAQPGPPKWLVVNSGKQQTAPVSTPLPAPIVVKLSDQYSNGIQGATVNFSDGGAGGTLSASSVITDNLGRASVTYITPPQAGTVHIVASSAGVTSISILETVTDAP